MAGEYASTTTLKGADGWPLYAAVTVVDPTARSTGTCASKLAELENPITGDGLPPMVIAAASAELTPRLEPVIDMGAPGDKCSALPIGRLIEVIVDPASGTDCTLIMRLSKRTSACDGWSNVNK